MWEVSESIQGRYQCRKLLGEGTQGRTWLATEIATNRDVAIKELKYLEDFKQLELFEREAEVLKSIDVPSVPKLYECILPENGAQTCYLVQQYIPYPSLLDVLAPDKPMSEGRVLNIMASVAQILYALENHYTPPIIHRDIKPSNILYSDSGEVWLIDFGAVANPQKASGGSTIAGTFGYMAPEQLQGSACIQSDYYALGATALHLLTGVSPATMDAKMFEIQFDDVLTQKAPKTSVECREFLHILLSPQVANRPQNAVELMGAIQNVCQGRSPKAGNRAGLERLEWNLFDRIFKFAPGRWPTCRGRIVQLTTVTDPRTGAVHDVFEVHYTLDARSYAGFVDIKAPDITFEPEENRALDALEVVGECVVSYCPGEPQTCILLPQKIYLSRKLWKKMERVLYKKIAPMILEHRIHSIEPKELYRLEWFWRWSDHLCEQKECLAFALYRIVGRISLLIIPLLEKMVSAVVAMHDAVAFADSCLFHHAPNVSLGDYYTQENDAIPELLQYMKKLRDFTVSVAKQYRMALKSQENAMHPMAKYKTFEQEDYINTGKGLFPVIRKLSEMGDELYQIMKIYDIVLQCGNLVGRTDDAKNYTRNFQWDLTILKDRLHGALDSLRFAMEMEAKDEKKELEKIFDYLHDIDWQYEAYIHSENERITLNKALKQYIALLAPSNHCEFAWDYKELLKYITLPAPANPNDGCENDNEWISMTRTGVRFQFLHALVSRSESILCRCMRRIMADKEEEGSASPESREPSQESVAEFSASDSVSDDVPWPSALRDLYSPIRRLGRGTQGAVYLALRNADGKRVAIKEIRIHSVQNWKEYDLFKREAMALKSIRMKGIAEFYDYYEFLEETNPVACIVQEYIEGRSLQDMIRSGYRFTLRRVFEIASKLLDIVESLHSHEPPIIHRDIKPSNILIRDLDADRFDVYLIDFGAVANPQVQGGGSTVAGTYGYMPPEQLMGSPCVASDFYSFAATLVHVLSDVDPGTMEVSDFRLAIDPHLQALPRPVVHLLHRMLEPQAEARLTDVQVLREMFDAFAKGRYPAMRDDADALVVVSDANRWNESLLGVRQLGQHGNMDLWMALPESDNRGNLPNVMQKGLQVQNKRHGSLVNYCKMALITLFPCVCVMVVLLTFFGGLLKDHIMIYFDVWLVVWLLTSWLLTYGRDEKISYRSNVAALYEHGRKCIATVVETSCVGIGRGEIVPSPSGGGMQYCLRKALRFRVRYSFNPPDDSLEENLVHEVIVDHDPTDLLRPGTPLPILYSVSQSDSSWVQSIPFPLPPSMLRNNTACYCLTVHGQKAMA